MLLSCSYRHKCGCHIGDMTVAESHDIALALQHKVEALEDVERCEPRL